MDLYVSSKGKVSGDGTFENPLSSIGDAVEVIKKVCFADRQEKFNIMIRGGTYYITEPIELRAKDFDGLNPSIVFSSYEQEKVVISGTMKISPAWEKYDEHIYVAEIGAGYSVDTLYVNGKKQIMARYPNYQDEVVLGGFARGAILPERVSRWSNPAGGYIRALHFSEWGGNSYRIIGKTDDNELLYEWVGDNNRGSGMHEIKRMVENIFEELDAPGEWFYNTDTGQLFYYPADDVEIAQAQFECAVAEELFRFIGESIEKPISRITLDGLILNKTCRTLFTRKYERPLRGDWGMVRAGAVFIQNAEDITIRNCTFEHIGSNGVMVSAYNKGHLIDHNDFTNIGATGVLLMGLMSAVRDPSTWDNDNHRTVISDFVPGPKTQDYPRSITISNNYMYNNGVYEKQTAGVCLCICEFITVSRNTIHHTPRAGINIHDGTFGGHIIEHNDVFDCVTETADHGPLNAWGRDRYWSLGGFDTNGKDGVKKRPFAMLDCIHTTVIRNNRFHGNYAFGIDLDDGASNYDVYNNLCLGVGIKLREGFDRKVHNNVLVGTLFEIHMSFALNNDLIYNNIVYNPKAYNFLLVNEGSTTMCINNLFWNEGRDISCIPENEIEPVFADPLFNNPSDNDFTVRQGSPALAMGFANFPMGNDDFGRADRPKPPVTTLKFSSDDGEMYMYHDVLLSNISNEGLRSAAGLPDYTGVYILAREVLGLFCRIGLPIGAGDVIRRIGEIPITCIDDFVKAFEAIVVGVPIRIEIYRNQQKKEFVFVKH